jgi:hypothetical protein
VNTESLDMRRVGDIDAVFKGAAGDYCIRDATAGQSFKYICMRLPGGSLCNIPIGPAPKEAGAAWDWNGDEDKPTLNPSVFHHGNPEWHGFIRDGRMVSC